MNLGDGLLFEVDNGKPRLLLLSHEVEENGQTVRADRKELTRQGRHAGRQGDSRSPASSTERSTTQTSRKTSKTKADSGSKSGTRLSQTKGLSTAQASRTNRKAGLLQNTITPANCKAGPVDIPTNHTPGLKGTVSCLTNEPQLQKVTVQNSPTIQHPLEDQDRRVLTHNTDSAPSGEAAQEHDRPAVCEEGHGLFSWLTGRDMDSRLSVNAKNSQWRRELDEQVALKQQIGSDPASLQNISHREQPSAIRSNIRLGEVPAGDEEQSLVRREQERRHWLQQLDRQREEMALRRRQDRQLQIQTEDHDLWARHFDSLQRRPLPPPPSTLSPHQEESVELWDRGSNCGGESVSGASSDTPSGQTNPTSYLRSMTALLDPVQVEERIRRRLNQQEHQRAIDAQVEERRLQREREEVRRREEEQAEERRVAQEREELERRFQMERDRERGRKKDHKKNAPKAQKAQQEALISRQEQPIMELLVKEREEEAISTQTHSDTSVQPALAIPPISPAPLSPARRGEAAEGNVCQPMGVTRRETRPAWHTHRPGGGFLLASERYPADLQKSRQESRMRRQAELLVLQEKNCVPRSGPAPPAAPPANPNPSQARASKKGGSEAIISERGRSRPIPAVRNRQQDTPTSQATPQRQEFVPYIRTDEVTMEPLQHTHTDLVHTSRQQEILSGLSLLRQGLLQKQRELEADMNPTTKVPW